MEGLDVADPIVDGLRRLPRALDGPHLSLIWVCWFCGVGGVFVFHCDIFWGVGEGSVCLFFSGRRVVVLGRPTPSA